MGTKQLRISDPEQIKIKAGTFLGKKINIVLLDNTVVFGKLKEVSSDDILMLNMRMKKVKYPFSSIAELYVDSLA
jgi:acetyl-CoA carboxylase carboxyltransferase component